MYYTNYFMGVVCMASINGVTIKSLKTFKDRDGENCYQGTVYLNGRKLGFWSQEGNGSVCDNYDFNTKLLEEPFLMWKNNLQDYHFYDYLDLEGFLYVLAYLMELEKSIKATIKKGCKYITYSISVADGYWVASGYVSKEAAENAKAKLQKKVLDLGSSYPITDVFEANKSSLDLILGNKDGFKREKKILDEKNKKLQDERTQYEKERKIKQDKINNNNRFSLQESSNIGMIIVVDNESGRKVEVPSHAYSYVLEALVELFGN